MSKDLKQIILEIKVVKMELAQTRRDLEDIGSPKWHELSATVFGLAQEIRGLEEEIYKMKDGK